MSEKQDLVQTENGPMTPEQIRASGRFYSPQMTWEEFCEKSRRRIENADMFVNVDLTPYRGKWVAWELDGSGIRASGESLLDVTKEIEDAGDDPQLYVYGRVPADEIR